MAETSVVEGALALLENGVLHTVDYQVKSIYKKQIIN